GEKRRVRPENRHESPEEHHLRAVPVEQIAGRLQLALVQVDLRTVPAGQRVAALVADPEPDVVADDRAGGRHQPDQPRVQVVGLAGIDRGHDQRGLGGQRYADALGGDQAEHSPVPVALDNPADAHSLPGDYPVIYVTWILPKIFALA